MTERSGLKMVGALLLGLAVAFGYYLTLEVIDLYRLCIDWHLKESYWHDLYMSLRICAVFIVAHWMYLTAKSGYAFWAIESLAQIGRPRVDSHESGEQPKPSGQPQQHQHQQTHNRPQQSYQGNPGRS